MTHRDTAHDFKPTPSPAVVAAQRAAEVARTQERERVKNVRKRRRLRAGATLTSHITDETAAALAKFAHPDTTH